MSVYIKNLFRSRLVLSLLFFAFWYILCKLFKFSVTRSIYQDLETKVVYHYIDINESLSIGNLNPSQGDEIFNLTRNYVGSDLVDLSSNNSRAEVEFLLNVRKLIAYSVYELNEPFKEIGCVKWWANPLDMISYYELSNNGVYSEQELRFIVNPGLFSFKVIITQKLPPIAIGHNELEITYPLEPLEHNIPYAQCSGAEKFIETVRKTCLCQSAGETTDLEKKSAEHRMKLNIRDKESSPWPPTASFSVPDYINFTDPKAFLIYPGQNKVFENEYTKEYCGPKIKMLIMISSPPSHFKFRTAIRLTFGNYKHLKAKGAKLVFLMGIPQPKSVRKLILQEANQQNDIIQVNIIDSHRNLTLTHLSMYKWVHITCEQGRFKGISSPKHILIADDQTLINVDLALKVSQNNSDVELIGCLQCGKKVNRVNYLEKNYTPRYIHISDFQVGYLSGGAYLIRSDVIPKLLQVSLTTPMITMDDVYVTGILSRQLKIYPRNSPLFTKGHIEPDSCATKKMVSMPVSSTKDMLQQWKKYIASAPSDCSLKDLQIEVPITDTFTKEKCYFG